MSNMTGGEIAKMLEKQPMQIGRVRNEVCTESDLDGKSIKPSGVKKILAHYEKEMTIIETATPEVVQVEALRQQVGNPRWLLAYDRERKQKVKVSVPANRKNQLSKPKTRFLVNRGSEDGTFFYLWTPKLKQ